MFKTREDYAYLGCLLERMATIEGGKEKAIQLRKQIISANPKKRALSEELLLHDKVIYISYVSELVDRVKNMLTSLDKVVLILGEEVHGIDYSLHELIDLFVEIPMQGQKESFNVSVAAGISIYGILSTKSSF